MFNYLKNKLKNKNKSQGQLVKNIYQENSSIYICQNSPNDEAFEAIKSLVRNGENTNYIKKPIKDYLFIVEKY